MIKGIYPSGKYITVVGGDGNSPSIYNSGSGQNSSGAISFAGQVRYNSSNQCIEIFDGSIWQSWNTTAATVGLSAEAEELLDWARQRRQEDVNLRMRMNEHPGLKDAYEKFKIMDALTLEEDKHGQ